MWALDTNLLVRLIVDDDPRQARRVEAWLQAHASAQKPAYVDHIVLCELAWVLAHSYGYARDQVHQCLTALLDQDVLKVESPVLVRRALAHYVDGPADFSDYLLAVRAKQAGFAPVLTFDRNAAKGSTHSLLKP